MLWIILICDLILASTSIQVNGVSNTCVGGASMCVNWMSDNSIKYDLQ